jgi:hypothetical protein
VTWSCRFKPYWGMGWMLQCMVPRVFRSMLNHMAKGI